MTTQRWQTIRRVLGACLVLTTALGVAVGPVTAADQQTEPAFVVQLQADGSAEVTLTLTYDLENSDQRDAFRTLQNDSDARTALRDRFASRMATVARDASNATGREMSVRDGSVELAVHDDVGVVRLSVTWTNLAAVSDDGRFVVTEPFASGFQPDRKLTVRGPDGYHLVRAAPSADASEANVATWAAGSNLSGFEAAFQSSADGDDANGGSGASGAGFGVVSALVALTTLALFLGRRR